ncbi:hypothetical protein PSTT_07610, partial [Puccinia striiformis]
MMGSAGSTELSSKKMTGTNQTEDNQSATMTIAKRIQPGALTVDKGRNTARPIPAFLTKLYTMVNDSSTDHLIKWNEPNGDSFFVVSSERFGRELLPKYFKHSNFGSFVRQLNMYGFHKVPHLNQGVLQGEIPETEMLEFTNINFQRAQPDLLCLIQRKKSCPESTHPATNEPNEPSSTAVPPNTNTTPPNTADLQTILMDIIYEKSPSNIALSLYSQIRHPRLMLEDTQRTSSSDPNSDPSTDNPSNLGPTLDHSSSLQNLSSNRNHILERLSSPTPSSLHTSSTTSSPKLGQSSTQFQDSSIDPNLETSTEINGTNRQSNQNPTDGSTTDDQQSSPDAVFQALFNNNNSSSSAGFNMNNSSMNGINWADLISSNGLNGFTEDMIESNPSNITSPLRITDGHINTTTPPLPSSSGALPSMDMNTDSCLQLINNTQNQANQILNLNNKDFKLLSFREQEREEEESAEDNILKEMITSSSTGPNSTTLTTTTTRGIDQFRSPVKAKEIARINENIEKFLDEWTPHEDHSRILSGLTPMIMSPVSTPTTDLPQNLPRVSNQRPPPPSSSSSTTLRSSNLLNSSSGPALDKTLKNRVAFDFNDDDHLRRIMSSKKNTSSTSTPSIPIPNHNNHNLDRSAASSVHSRKRLLDDSVPISDQTSTAHLFNLLNSSENHHHNPTFNSLTTHPTPASSNSNIIHNKTTRL